MNKRELGRLIELYISRIGKLRKLSGVHSPFMTELIKLSQYYKDHVSSMSPILMIKITPPHDSLSFIFYAFCAADVGKEIDDGFLDWAIEKRNELQKQDLLSPDKLVALILLHSAGLDTLAGAVLVNSRALDAARAFFILAKAGGDLTDEGFCRGILKSKLPMQDAEALVNLHTAGVALEELPNFLQKPQLRLTADTAVKLHSIGMPYNQEFLDTYILITSSYVTPTGLKSIQFLNRGGIKLPPQRCIAVLISVNANAGLDVLSLHTEELLPMISDEQFAKIINQEWSDRLINCLSQLRKLGNLNLSTEQITYIINLPGRDWSTIGNRIDYDALIRKVGLLPTLSTEQLDRIIRAVTPEGVAEVIKEARRADLDRSNARPEGTLPAPAAAASQPASQFQLQLSNPVRRIEPQPSQRASVGATALFKPVAQPASRAAVPALEVLQYDKDADIPRDYICPITHELMVDPVVAKDGHTYERTAIKEWLQTSNKSPMTGAFLESKELTPNFTLRSIVRDWCEKNPPRSKKLLNSN